MQEWTPNKNCGAQAIMNVLRVNNVREPLKSAEDFKAYIIELADWKSKYDPVYQTHCQIRDIKKANVDTLQHLQQSLQESRVAYFSCTSCLAIQELEEKVKGAQLACDGLRAFVEKGPAELECVSDALRARLQKKLASAEEKLALQMNTLAECQTQLLTLIEATPEFREYQEAQAANNLFLEEIGVKALLENSENFQKISGRSAGMTGKSYEDANLSLIHERIIPSLIEEGNPGPFQVLQGCTLGCGISEFDYLVVQTEGETEADEDEAPTQATILAVVEVKRNINDIGKSFSHMQKTWHGLLAQKSCMTLPTSKIATTRLAILIRILLRGTRN